MATRVDRAILQRTVLCAAVLVCGVEAASGWLGFDFSMFFPLVLIASLALGEPFKGGVRLRATFALTAALTITLLLAPSAEAVFVTARQRPDLRDLAELLALANSGGAPPKSALPDALFAGGHRLQSAQTPLVTFEGWAAHDLGDGHCEVIAYFRPSVAISGQQVWIHEYPENSHVYSYVSRAMPPGQWAPGELGWEVFRPLQTERFILYAGTERDGDLGPAVLFGRVQTCRRPSS